MAGIRRPFEELPLDVLTEILRRSLVVVYASDDEEDLYEPDPPSPSPSTWAHEQSARLKAVCRTFQEALSKDFAYQSSKYSRDEYYYLVKTDTSFIEEMWLELHEVENPLASLIWLIRGAELSLRRLCLDFRTKSGRTEGTCQMLVHMLCRCRQLEHLEIHMYSDSWYYRMRKVGCFDLGMANLRVLTLRSIEVQGQGGAGLLMESLKSLEELTLESVSFADKRTRISSRTLKVLKINRCDGDSEEAYLEVIAPELLKLSLSRNQRLTFRLDVANLKHFTTFGCPSYQILGVGPKLLQHADIDWTDVGGLGNLKKSFQRIGTLTWGSVFQDSSMQVMAEVEDVIRVLPKLSELRLRESHTPMLVDGKEMEGRSLAEVLASRCSFSCVYLVYLCGGKVQ